MMQRLVQVGHGELVWGEELNWFILHIEELIQSFLISSWLNPLWVAGEVTGVNSQLTRWKLMSNLSLSSDRVMFLMSPTQAVRAPISRENLTEVEHQWQPHPASTALALPCHPAQEWSFIYIIIDLLLLLL